MSENPYASPTQESGFVPEAGSSSEELRIATRGKRFLNFILDSIIFQIVSFAIAFGVGSLLFASGTLDPLTVEDESTFDLVSTLISLALSVAYHAIWEGLFQRTPAKFLTGTLVVTATGARPSFGQIIGRSFARLIPFDAFSFLGRPNPVGWHDSLSGTRVISNR